MCFKEDNLHFHKMLVLGINVEGFKKYIRYENTDCT